MDGLLLLRREKLGPNSYSCRTRTSEKYRHVIVFKESSCAESRMSRTCLCKRSQKIGVTATRGKNTTPEKLSGDLVIRIGLQIWCTLTFKEGLVCPAMIGKAGLLLSRMGSLSKGGSQGDSAELAWHPVSQLYNWPASCNLFEHLVSRLYNHWTLLKMLTC